MPISPTKQSDTNPPKVVLVLGGGGTKGIAHLGALEVLQKANIPIDLIIGCSIGALLGAFYADGQTPQHILERAKKLLPRRPNLRSFGFPSLSKGILGKGFFSTQRLYKILAKEISAQTFEELKIPLEVVATDISQGTLKTFNQGPLLAPICASAAIPGIFQAVDIEGKQYVDGSVISRLPIRIAQQKGAKLVIASNVKGWTKLEQHKDIENVGLRSYRIMRHHFDQQEESKADINIHPNLSGVMNLLFSNPKIMDEVYRRGKKSAEEQLPYIQKQLDQL